MNDPDNNLLNIKYLGGTGWDTEAWGKIGIYPFYFRIHPKGWAFTVSLDPELDPSIVDPVDEQCFRIIDDEDENAYLMSDEKITQIIKDYAEAFEKTYIHPSQ